MLVQLKQPTTLVKLKILETEFEDEVESQIIAIGRDGRFLGTVCVGHKGRRAAYIKQLFVHPSMRRKGIGSQLIEEGCRLSRESGCETLGLVLSKGNDSAEKFYHSLGFIFGYQYDDGDTLRLIVLQGPT